MSTTVTLRYTIWNALQRIILSERAAWAAQNAVGAVIPILFVVVNDMKFSGSCTAILFYGISSQAFSIDRSIGGRVFGAILWTGGYLFGGILAYLITSLAWLARGSAEGILTYEYTGATLTPGEENLVQSYLKDASFTKIPNNGDELNNGLVPKLEESLEEFNSKTVSSAFYILLIVFHICCSIYMSRCRTMESDFMSTARGTLSHIFLSVMSTLAMLLPLLGQHKYWSSIIGGNLKGVTITMFGAIAGPMLVYVQSAHDNLRRNLGEVMINSGKFLTAQASVWHQCLLQRKGMSDSDEGAMNDLDAVRKTVRKLSGISNVQELIKATLKAEGDIACCTLEPVWPMFVSQVGMDYRLYQEVLLSLQRLLGSINAMTSVSIDRCGRLSAEEARIANTVLECSLAVSTALQDVAVSFKHLPVWGHCSGNKIAWRPKGAQYWNYYLIMVHECYQQSLSYFKTSACTGIAASFAVKGEQEEDLAGLQIIHLSASESLIEECIALEHLAAKALGITDLPYKETTYQANETQRTGTNRIENFPEKRQPFSKRFFRILSRRWKSTCQNVYLIALFSDLKQATSYYTYKLQLSRFVSTNVSLFRGRWIDMVELKQLLHRRDFQFYLKFLIAINLSFMAIILILWLGYGNTESAVKNATSMANWFGNWQPEYFLTAAVICLQKQVEISVVKAILRTSVIAFGGVLGYVTMLNGTLAQNPYYILFMGVLVNGFFGIFSIYGMDFRYSLFLAVYTWNGVVMCQYTGVCCQSGTVLTFGGKATSTCLGAVWALIFSILIKPLYTSEVIFSLESSFLSGAMGHLEKSYDHGGSLMLTMAKEDDEVQDDETHSKGTFEERLVQSQQNAEQLQELRSSVNEITRLRISSYKAYGQQVTLNSLDKREVTFLTLNLIPLPESVHLVMSHVSPIGAFASGSSKLVYIYTLGRHGGPSSKRFLQHILEPTDSIMAASRTLVESVSRFLERRSNSRVQEIREKILKDVAALRSARKDVHKIFVQLIQPEILKVKSCTVGDIKCFAWYIMIMSSMTQLEELGSKIGKDNRYLERDDYSSFFVSWYTRRNQNTQ